MTEPHNKRSNALPSTSQPHSSNLTYYCVNDGHWVLGYLSEGCYPLTGYQASELIGKPYLEHDALIHPEDRPRLKQQFEHQLTLHQSFNSEYRIITKSGAVKWVSDQAKLNYSNDGQLLYIDGCIIDISERKQREQQFANLSARYQRLMALTGQGVLSVTADGVITQANQVAASLLGETPANLVNMPLAAFTANNDLALSLKNKTDTQVIGLLLQKDGAEKIVEYTVHDFDQAEDGSTHLVIFEEAPSPKGTERQLVDQANQDFLTGLYNRRYFYTLVSNTLNSRRGSARAFGLMLIDVDDFKQINEHFGHLAGDEILKFVAARLNDNIRRADVLARISGDEFALLVEGDGFEQLTPTCDHIVSSLGAPVLFDHARIKVSVSIGIAMYPYHGNELNDLLRCADIALSDAKRTGKNTYRCYDAPLGERMSQKLQDKSNLQSAIKRKKLSMVYQFRFDARRSEICGAEALVRINIRKPSVPYSTAQYVALAEDMGLAVQLGDWVLARTIYDISILSKRGFLKEQDRISINISNQQLIDPDFVDKLCQELARFKIDTHHIELEITERCLVEKNSVPVLSALKDKGFTISIDDFGTGYSSLYYLASLPVDMLKIDAIFITNMLEHKKYDQVVQAIIQLGHNLGFKVVAEGVENEQQAHKLIQYGCDQLQGFWLARPESFGNLALHWHQENTAILSQIKEVTI